MDIGKIGFGLPPDQRLKEQGAYIAHASFPFLREGIIVAREGRVTMTDRAIDLLLATLNAYAPMIENSDLDETEKLLLHGVFTLMMNSIKGGMVSEKKMKMIIAVFDIFVEMYGEACHLLDIEVDRSGE